MKNIELEAYLQEIHVPVKVLSALEQGGKIDYLNLIYSAHVQTFPYSNFELRTIGNQHPIQRSSLTFFSYNNLLSSEHGGYCFQSAALLFDALSQLGYKVSFCAARVLLGAPINSPDVLKLPPTHLVLTVTIDDKKFLLDPGLGSSAPRLPILITENDEAVLQDEEEFKFYPQENVSVLERKTSQGWFRLIQTDLVPIDQKTASLNLLKLERHPTTIAIRDTKTVIGIITEHGRKSLIWDAQSKQLKYVKHDKDENIQEIVTNFDRGHEILTQEFNIHHISAQDLQIYCTETALPRPKNPWLINFPIDENELKTLAKNLTF